MVKVAEPIPRPAPGLRIGQALVMLDQFQPVATDPCLVIIPTPSAWACNFDGEAALAAIAQLVFCRMCRVGIAQQRLRQIGHAMVHARSQVGDRGWVADQRSRSCASIHSISLLLRAQMTLPILNTGIRTLASLA